VCRENGTHGFGWEGRNSNVPLDPNRIEDKTVPDYGAKPLAEVKTILGCDLGVTKLVHLSDGYQFDNPKFGWNQ